MGETTVFDMSKGGSFAEAYIAARNASLENRKQTPPAWIDLDTYLQENADVHC
jgi:hypothetical protein